MNKQQIIVAADGDVFEPGQWWLRELEGISVGREPTPDQVRAVAAARKLAATVFDQAAKLYWADRGPRMGWWLDLPDGKTWALMGPPICESAGGGASAAVHVARSMGWAGGITVDPVAHKTYPNGKPCDCSGARTTAVGAAVHPDTARLDWMEQDHAQTYRFDSTGHWRVSDEFGPQGQADTLRGAIDAARTAANGSGGQK